MIKLKPIIEHLGQWNKKYWIHYSDVDYLAINRKYRHHEPRGIYLFPLNIKLPRVLKSYWKDKKYKTIVKLPPNLNILDFSTIDIRKGKEILLKGGYPDLVDYMTKYEWIFKYKSGLNQYFDSDTKEKLNPYKEIKPIQMFWGIVTRVIGDKSDEAITEFFQEAGYDGIFDDTSTIMPLEHQLIIFDPSVIQVVKRIPNNLRIHPDEYPE